MLDSVPETTYSDTDSLNKKPFLLFITIFVIFFLLAVWYAISQQRPSAVAVKNYHKDQVQNTKSLERALNISRDEPFRVTEDNIDIFIKYANSLTRQSDFGYSGRVKNTQNAIDVYNSIVNSSLPAQYKVFAINEIYTTFIQSGSDVTILSNLFTQNEVQEKLRSLHLDIPIKDLDSYRVQMFVYQNLLMDKEVESVAIEPTKIALARISMQEYLNQMLFRTQVYLTSATSTSENDSIKKEFSDKVVKNYEMYKTAEANTLKPDTFYQAEAAYLMAWSLNRAGIYLENQEYVDESYKLFKENIAFIDSLKSTNNNVWHLSILNKVFYATAVLGSNKDAFIDPENVKNRQEALSILSELASPEFMSDRRYYGARNYLTNMRKSDVDWITVLMLLSKYDAGLAKNLKALNWSI